MSVDTDNRGAKDTSKAPAPLTGAACRGGGGAA